MENNQNETNVASEAASQEVSRSFDIEIPMSTVQRWLDNSSSSESVLGVRKRSEVEVDEVALLKAKMELMEEELVSLRNVKAKYNKMCENAAVVLANLHDLHGSLCCDFAPCQGPVSIDKWFDAFRAETEAVIALIEEKWDEETLDVTEDDEDAWRRPTLNWHEK